jgi:hypothetical protein
MNAIILKGAALRQPPLPQSGPRAKTIAHPWLRAKLWDPGKCTYFSVYILFCSNLTVIVSVSQLLGIEPFLRDYKLFHILSNPSAHFGPQTFTAAFTRALHRFLSWARLIHSVLTHPIHLRYNLTLPTSWSSEWSLRFWFPPKNSIYILFIPH